MNHINNINVFCDSFREGNMILYKHYDDDNSTVFRFRNRHTVGRGIGGFGTLGFLPKIDVSNIYAIVIKFQDRNVEEACKLLENCEIPAQQMIQDNKKSVKGEIFINFLKQMEFYVSREEHTFFTSYLVTIKKSPDDEPRHESLEILYHDKIKTELGLDSLGTSSATFARTYLIKVLSNYVVNM
ncbi:uncharacterized protein OCT59_004774 [Rhizophagus irregularis]|uniref:Uncharacterized protein n=2 Tax=Rhizophagus irregularis TaxID=588596 RepID=A0A015JGQ0_RHIIW|nr:hypothetical protein GLOIN_2v1822430 [Rhizophagus irregularis DAOM 181602=DAOM 197198]EXX68657.1 hypothetical protein RirG_103190 [Rhizophagus irregularis DAOM 197198w]UZO13270.1 hypothetical protein OCT59_004774 [Rhizophagus irregularis]POG58138.1 hypothetical protein GLOIN_2v1822430 [Rhizophagus irregularis DAOM 181602=DAOM 197198]CAG8714408.1 21698_t:CDS:1 [Rhizophagus irregularis]GBC21893.2 hypothetical protein GLOIN_2v1822430 [Rhizophagus irregularis DAOM 181602=DAOM 197198]|eukprot:XP_025165004.1 hypothetical protein GLOIN_2v1822430 [Rhizophagus irregularis DAOM 181602=DAOM 197198]